MTQSQKKESESVFFALVLLIFRKNRELWRGQRAPLSTIKTTMKKFIILLSAGTAFALASCASQSPSCCGKCKTGECAATSECEAGCKCAKCTAKKD